MVEGQPRQRVEVGRDPGGELGRRGDPTTDGGGGLQTGVGAGDRRGEGPATGEGGIGQGDESDRIGAQGHPAVGLVHPQQCGLGREAPHLDRTIAEHEHRPGTERPVVKPADARGLERRGGLTGEAARLLRRQAAGGHQGGEGAGAAKRLLDDEGDPVALPHVEYPHQPDLLDAGRSAGRVHGSRGRRALGGKAEDDDLAHERLVLGGPPLEPWVDGHPPSDEVASAEERPWTQALHSDPLRSARTGSTDSSACLDGPTVEVAVLGCHPTGP